jgi:hypothetical protein
MFIGSGITSVIFSPFVIHYIQPQPDAEFVLFVSDLVGLCAVGFVRSSERCASAVTSLPATTRSGVKLETRRSPRGVGCEMDVWRRE